jgi:hypothetical protein
MDRVLMIGSGVLSLAGLSHSGTGVGAGHLASGMNGTTDERCAVDPCPLRQ